jgi:ribonuclease P protein component
MFKKTERLGRSDFTGYFKAGRRFQSPTLTIVYTPAVSFKVAVVVGKKVAKQAVERNRIRRRLYATLRRFKESYSITNGVFIIIVKPPAYQATRVALAAQANDLLASVLKPR